MLSIIYDEISTRLHQIEFKKIWNDFNLYKFAVYNDSECFFDGRYISKTDEFLANTSILYQGEFIAIWKINEPFESIDFDELTSKIVHEMFHAFQQQSHENRYPNEMEALMQYTYDRTNLSIKLQEAQYLNSFFISGNRKSFDDFLKCRKHRLQTFPYETTYESQVEQIEGTAQYVELLALEQLNESKGQSAWKRLFENTLNPKSYFPIRVISYAIGATVLRCLSMGELSRITKPSSIPFSLALLEEVETEDIKLSVNSLIDHYLDTYNTRTNQIIQAAIIKDDCLLEGEYPLLGINIYDARCQGQYLTSTYFVMVEDQGVSRVFNGDFVIELNENNKVIRLLNQA